MRRRDIVYRRSSRLVVKSPGDTSASAQGWATRDSPVQGDGTRVGAITVRQIYQTSADGTTWVDAPWPA